VRYGIWASAFICVLISPVVILPEDLIETLGSRGLRDVLVHESAHALRHDPLVGFLQRLLASAFWPYPPVHLVNRWLAGAREEVCDNYVLRQGDAPSYAETLLTISEMFRCVRMPPAATAADSTSTVQRRAVNKLVKDFPEKLDLSTPESAVAAICRAAGRKDIHAMNDLLLVPWEKDVAGEIQQAMKHDPHAPKHLEQTMLGVEVVEVLTCRDDFALVICRAKSPEGKRPYQGVPFARINGTWKGTCPWDEPGDKDSFPTVQAAREYFDKNRDNLRKSLLAAKGKRIGSPAKADQSSKMAAQGKAGPGTSGARPWTLANGTTMWEGSSGPAIKEELKQLIAQKKYKFLSTFDSPNGEKQYVYSFVFSDGSEIAFPRADYGSLPPSVKQTSWQEHLQAIRDGRRTLLELETVNSYTYEMTADDGTKLTFQYGGGNPLKMAEK